METVTPIFESTGQAVHVAFTVLAQDAPQDGMLRKALIRILDDVERTPALDDWLHQLRGTPSDTVHFGGLSLFDIRATCAMIYSSICTKLPDPERWALQAKYGSTEVEGAMGRRRFAFSAEKAEAIRGLTNWICDPNTFCELPAPFGKFPSLPRESVLMMVARFYAHHSRTKVSYRDLAASFGGSRMVYARAWPKVKARLQPLEHAALARLETYFIASGIVAPHAD